MIKEIKKATTPSFDSFFTSDAYHPIDRTEAYNPKTIVEAEKEKLRAEIAKEMEKYTFEEWEAIVAKKYYNRRHVGWPCDDAQDIPVGDNRNLHIKTCPECKRLLDELNKKVYTKKSPPTQQEIDEA